ncbi:sugar phosphate isomerase/epimerase [Marinoscillum sp. MHG1-6]|uniref:sugar phosphate isomerase/epimerase family protein n=1 Tax=Marinoscillum sp. MHG1-6 TaxID=2959627 RepID=UPI0021582CE4|nr:sugar phosphate isomerase/epimerase family protein [Marinoscillum sp. MHG1-6]
MSDKQSRRSFLSNSAFATAALVSAPLIRVGAEPGERVLKDNLRKKKQRYKVSVCDWMILKRQKMGAFKRTAEIGADGLELDMGGLGNRPIFDNKMRDPVFRKMFREELEKYNLELSSIAMSGFYAQSLAERDIAPMIDDAINSMVMMGVKTSFLPFGVKGDMVQNPELRPILLQKFKEIVVPKAEAADVIIGIETAYDAAREAEFLEEIGSPNIQSYFNFANALQNDRDLIKELETLGKDRICMIHASDEDGVWLENNERIDMSAVKKCLDDIGWGGWLVIERSRDANNPRDVVGNYGANTRYLKSIFQ